MIGAVENGILARLKLAADNGALGYPWGTLETYPVDWDEYLRDKVIVAPAAWAMFAGWGTLDPDAAFPRVPASFGVVVMAENVRNETATRHGGPQPSEPGSYQLMMDVAGLLGGQDLGLPIGALELGAVRPVRPPAALRERRVSMFAIELRTVLAVQSLDPAGPPELADFATFHANWDVPAFGGIDRLPGVPGVQLPDDARADATDHLTLETLP